MTVNAVLADTKKALYSEGSWHLMEVRDKYVADDFPHASILYHQCSNYFKQEGKSKVWIPAILYRIDVHELTIPCRDCGSVCPESLQGLWTLHNFDTVQSEGSIK